MHGADGPVPIRRLPKDQWPPVSKALQGFADERQIPFVADMNADFRDGYAVAPISNWPDKRGSAAICYLTAGRARAAESHHRQRRDRDRHQVRRPPRHRRQRRDRRRDARIHRPRDHRQPRRHPFAGDADAQRHRRRAAHLREHGIAVRADMPGVGANLSNHSLLFIGFHCRPRRGSRRRCGRIRRRCSAFRPACRAARAPTCTSTCRARPRGARSARGSPISRRRCGSRWGAAAWRSRSTDHRQEPLVEMNFAGHELDLKRLMVGFRLAVEMLAYREGERDARRDVPGEVHRPAAPAQRQDHGSTRSRARRSPG